MSILASKVDPPLQIWLHSKDTYPPGLLEAMQYALFPGGKRLRPQLVYLAAQCGHVADPIADSLALAIELAHTYSLVHDDLPAMDNDDTRRGRASCHRAFDESTAILVGNALLVGAYDVLLNIDLPAHTRCQLLTTLNHSLDGGGLIAGQYLDLHTDTATLSDITTLHRLKTGLLFQACIDLVLLTPHNIPSAIADDLPQFAALFGQAYQLRDDARDAHSDTTNNSYHIDAKTCQNLYQQTRTTLQQLCDRWGAPGKPFTSLCNSALGSIDHIDTPII